MNSVRENARDPILCIGISVVGLVDYRRQEVRLAPTCLSR